MQQDYKRVYPSQRTPAKWLSYLLLFLSAVVIFSGLAGQRVDQPIIEAAATATPIPLNEAFDETPDAREIALEGASWYALQLGAFEDEAAAKQLAAQFASRGASGYVWHEGRYRALAAIYPTKEDAQNVRRQLLEQHSIESWLYEIALPPLKLNTKGMKGQIDILEAAFGHTQTLIQQLQAYSVQMDRRELNGTEALGAVQTLDTQTRLIALRLEQRFSTPRNPTVQALIQLFQDYSAFSESLAKTEDAVTLGQRLKYQAIQTLNTTKAIVNQLYIGGDHS